MDNATGYRRSTGSPRGAARRRELLTTITDDVAENGLVDFSLRRAARAAGTTHKVLLYHFESAEDLLRQVVLGLRERRIGNALAAVASEPATLTDRVRAAWVSLRDEESELRRVLDQAMGLAMYDPGRYAALGRGASQQYLPTLMSFCPPEWPERRRFEVASMILATLRGFLVDLLTSDDGSGAEAGFEALLRAVAREEALDTM
ncbi:TetR/AcrR family transcriptional regulator [Amycolatopsis sp. OK19-0408]|uniref:TetR/AcrR family transcriptional regulator n=1 Tax=Amycolatopsis iheyensis TaxID=2945988 RepID=A0A9X2SPA9_9PSEU|nr:TetR/AcrR family transcriptional regulator [Amycolatopsis iheyensis]MCR6488006.1 TetR/AcrR family transcriptional regulator [Amycolatopsis iheyensis]